MAYMTKSARLQRLKERAFAGPAGNVFRGMATLAMGSIAARVIGAASIPILTRLYSPEDFGALAVFTSFISILAPIITLRYVLALPLPRRDGMAINLLVLSAGLMLCMSLIVGLGLWAFGLHLLGLFSMEVLAPYWWLIILGLIGGSGYEMLSLWATRKRAYKPVARTTAMQSLLGNATKMILGFLAIKPLGLLIGQVVSTSGGIASLWLYFRQDFAKNRRFISFSRIKLVAGRYRHFPTYRLPSQFLLVFAQQMPIMFIAGVFGAATLGQFALAKMLVSLPVQLLSGALSNSAYGELAKIGRKDPHQIKKILISTTKALFNLSLLPALGIFFLSPLIFPWLFGTEWGEAGYFSSGLSVYLVSIIVAVPMSAFINVFEKQGEFFLWNVIRCTLVSLVCAATIILELTAISFVFAYSVMMLVYASALILRTYRIVTSACNLP